MGILQYIKADKHDSAPDQIYNGRLYAAGICAASAAIMIGYDSAFFGTSLALPSFKNEFSLNPPSYPAADFTTLSANIVSVYQAGAFFGALSAYPIAFFLGRKYGMLIAAIICFAGSAIMLAANGSRGLGPIFAGRAIAGVGIGQASSMAPLYISEIAPPQIRGQLIGMYEIAWQIGGIVGFWINYGVSLNLPMGFTQWFTPFAVQLIPSGLFAILIPIVVKESPRWLIQRGRREQAIKNLCYLRNLPGDHPYLIEEVNAVTIQVEHDVAAVGAGFMAPVRAIFTSWRLTRRLLLTTSLFIFQNGTGINAVNYYSPTFFRTIGVVGTNTTLLTTGVFGVIKSVGALLWAFWWVDRYGRRAVLVVGSVGGAVAMLVIGAILGKTNPAANPTTTLPPSGQAAVAFFYIWTAFYAIGWNGTPWVVNSESFPGAVRLVSSTAAAASNWLWNFVISRSTPTMFAQMGASGFGVYLFFGFMQVAAIFYVLFLLPETKGIPLEFMDALFDDKAPITAHKRVMAQVQREHDQYASGATKEYLKPSGDHNLFEHARNPSPDDVSDKA